MKSRICMMFLAATAAPAGAEIVAASPEHYELHHEATSSLTPEELWERLIHPEDWWAPAHTYSGDAANLSLDLQAGGLWREDWDGGSVSHGSVLMVREGEQLRLDAPFGPLQGMAVKVSWTITIEPDGEGARATFKEVANGSVSSALGQIAPAVDSVKSEAMQRLTARQVTPDAPSD
ncbi:hypothetical protein [Henriciella sp.]|uniref:SRPBCC family protein n=1 Tax=Henriciella sp. TaxID=1968823 RepID=UPI00261822A3|nr:hypothetical protein [Henriciella sp.]